MGASAPRMQWIAQILQPRNATTYREAVELDLYTACFTHSLHVVSVLPCHEGAGEACLIAKVKSIHP
jgi:hypothetical protein